MSRTILNNNLIGSGASTFLGFGHNRILNGDMQIDQANAGAALTVNATALFYSADSFIGFGQPADGVFTIQQTNVSPPTGFLNSLKITVTTADASIGASQTYLLISRIEGQVLRDFMYGTANAATATLSFWVKSSITGTFGGAFENGADTRTYPYTYVINSANTWEYKTVTFAGDTTGTWATDNTLGLNIYWSMGTGSNGLGTPGAWANQDKDGAIGQTNLISTNGATWQITGVQLELGSTASPFEYLPVEVVLPRLQRYLETTYNGAAIGSASNNYYDTAVASQINTTTMRSQSIYFKARKRVQPTVTLYTTAGDLNQWNWINTAGTNTKRNTIVTDAFPDKVNIGQTTAVEYLAQGHWVADARL